MPKNYFVYSFSFFFQLTFVKDNKGIAENISQKSLKGFLRLGDSGIFDRMILLPLALCITEW